MRLRYILGGDRPSQTTRLALFTARIHGAVLETQHIKGGISRMAPPDLASRFQRLPPILHITILMPVRSYSKGAWGLSV